MEPISVREFGQPPAEEEGVDWRLQYTKDDRQGIVNALLDTFWLFPVQEGRKMATRYEEEIFHEATSKSDYLRKISLKLNSVQEEMTSSIKKGMAEFLKK